MSLKYNKPKINRFKIKIIKILYSLLFLPLALARILIKVIKNKNPEYLYRIYERIGFYKNKNINNIDIWFHAVSVGEFIALKILIEELLKIKPDYKILITSTTPTGSKLVQEFISKTNQPNQNKYYLFHSYYPYDLNIICKKFLKFFKPKLAVFMETEIWPNMFEQINKNNIKLYIINARLSDKSCVNYHKYKIIKNYISDIIKKADLIAAQTQADQNNFIKIGANKNNIKVLGNIKYNLQLPKDLDEISSFYQKILLSNNYNNTDKKTIFIAASTHKGEEEIILDIYNNLINKYNKNILLILVPRHPERSDYIYDLCNKVKYKHKDKQLNIKKYSDIIKNNISDLDIFIVDTIGKLLYFYNISDLVFIGGSLVAVGGHNPLEPALLKKASIIGPNYYNFTDIVQNLSDNNGLIIANNKIELEQKILELLNNEDYSNYIGNSAYCVVQQQGNIINKYLKLILAK